MTLPRLPRRRGAARHTGPRNAILPKRFLRGGFTLVEMLSVIAIIGLLVALLLPAIQSAREAARRLHCNNNLRQLALGFSGYASTNGAFPAFAMSWENEDVMKRTGGIVGGWYDDHGWYSQLGPNIEQLAWSNTIRFDRSFSDVINETARRAKIPLYACPNDGLKENEWHHAAWARVRGNYAVNAGNTNYGQTTKGGVDFGGAPFGPRNSPPLAKIRDGMSNTLLMAEIITTTTLNGWGGPISDISTACGGQTFSGWLPPNSHIPDHSTRWCPVPADYNGIPGCTIIDWLTPKEGSFAARSKHPGGVSVAICDGSTRFISDSVDLLTVWRPLTTAWGRDIPGQE